MNPWTIQSSRPGSSPLPSPTSITETPAVDTTVIDIHELSPIADFFVICSGENERQLRAISRTLLDALGDRISTAPRRRRAGLRLDPDGLRRRHRPYLRYRAPGVSITSKSAGRMHRFSCQSSEARGTTADETGILGRSPDTRARRPTGVIKNGPITFSIGAILGALAGFILGAFLGKYALHLVSHPDRCRRSP